MVIMMMAAMAVAVVLAAIGVGKSTLRLTPIMMMRMIVKAAVNLQPSVRFQREPRCGRESPEYPKSPVANLYRRIAFRAV
jgi:hypothetical protein